MTISDAAAQAARQRLVRLAAFLCVDSAPAVRAWSGVGPFTLEPSSFDPVGGRFLGVGWMNNIPDLSGLLHGEAEQVTFTLSGVDQRTIDLVDASAADVEGAKARLGFMLLNRRQQPIDGIFWRRSFRVSVIGWSDAPAGTDPRATEVRVRTASLTLDTALSARRRGQLLFWTPAAQARRSPTDKAFEHVPGFNSTTTRLWPPQ